MFFFSDFNGSWAQYVDAFAFAIPGGLDMYWKWNVHYPNALPLKPFHDYILHNQIFTDSYYNAYPLASTNDLKSAQKLKAALINFDRAYHFADPQDFKKNYHRLLCDLQGSLGDLGPAPAMQASEGRSAERGRAPAVMCLNKKETVPVHD